MSKNKEKNKLERKSRRSLTLLFAGITFVITLAVTLVVGGAIFALVRTGAITELTENVFNNGVIVAILLSLASLVIAVGMTFFISRIITKPLNRIINAMNKVASGDFRARIEIGRALGSHPSVKEFTDSFNTMAEELEHTEIIRSDFIDNFSHEFKTPIVSIAGFANLLKRSDLTQQQRDEYTDIIAEESIRLSEMATNVLNLTKIENQTILTDVSLFNLSEQIRSCVLLLEEKWTAKDIYFDINIEREYYIKANEELLKQVWINLLDNAIKFSYPGKAITIDLVDKGTSTVVSITDEGQRIQDEDKKRIFNKFYQTDKSHASEGYGIGLAVVSQILRLHKAGITVESSDAQTVFSVALRN